MDTSSAQVLVAAKEAVRAVKVKTMGLINPLGANRTELLIEILAAGWKANTIRHRLLPVKYIRF
jgi:hypothetical protein